MRSRLLKRAWASTAIRDTREEPCAWAESTGQLNQWIKSFLLTICMVQTDLRIMIVVAEKIHIGKTTAHPT